MDGEELLKDPSKRPPVLLPDEILLKIIRACVEPYSLKVHQEAYMPEKVAYILDASSYDYYFEKPIGLSLQCDLDGKSLDGGLSITIHPTITAVREFTTFEKRIEYVVKPSSLSNIKLVNKKLCSEVKKALKAKFDGHLIIDNNRDFFAWERSKGWSETRKTYHGDELAWLNPLVTKISFTGAFTANQFDEWKYSNLRVVNVSMQPPTEELGGGEYLAGEDDEAIVELLQMWMAGDDLEGWLNLDRLRERNISATVDFESYPRGNWVEDPYTSLHFRFKVEVAPTKAFILRDRQQWYGA